MIQLYQIILINFNKIFLKKKLLYGNLIEKLRYGENPHQESAIYSQSFRH